ncbi:MAG: dicarboxylate/amino acid:cation symporter [Kiritimatiellae bacterium]|nr:dicarboxylate/amino acid:cation symporter [Kiritimatiellia bacterium]
MRFSLGARILLGIVVGVLTGLIFPAATSFISPLGDIFLRLLKMLMVPLVFFSVTDGICKMGDTKQLSSVGLRFIVYVLITSAACALFGALAALQLNLGEGATGFTAGASNTVAVQGSNYSFAKTVVNFFPDNVLGAMASGELVQVIVFSLFLGVALLSLGSKVSKVTSAIEQCAHVMIKITGYVMEFSPFGIAALMADMLVTVNGAAMKELLSFVLSVNVLCFLVLVLMYPLLVKSLAHVKGFVFLKKIHEPLLVALSTTSSAATLPVSLETARKKLGVPENIFSFTLPLGNTCGMNGFALVVGLFSVFAFNLCGREVTFLSVVQFTFLGVILSVGAAGVKGAGIIMTTMLLEIMGLDLALVPIVAAIWPLIDPAMTVVNNASDLAGTVIVAEGMKNLNKEVYK